MERERSVLMGGILNEGGGGEEKGALEKGVFREVFCLEDNVSLKDSLGQKKALR